MSQPPADLAALLAALERGESLPANWYTDPAITAREHVQIFRKSWSYVGPLSELRAVGDFIAGYAGAVPVVAVRGEDGLRAFVNVCRHRRHEVMQGRGNARMLQCRYHAWAYDLSGCLTRAPRSAVEPGFRLDDYPLLPIRVDALGPFVFVHVDPEARPLAACFGPLLDLIRESGIDLDTLELYRRDTWRSDANWKAMLENFLECYHCAVAHPGFSAAIDVRPEHYRLTARGWYLSQVGHVRPSALEGKTAVKIYDARGEVAQAQYHLLWPNVTISINPGFPNLSIDVWNPDGPTHTSGFSEQYFAPGVSEEFARELIAFNAQVGAEDDALTTSVQRGLAGGLPDRGRFLMNSEHLVVHFQKLVAAALTGGADAAARVADAQGDPVTGVAAMAPSGAPLARADMNAYRELEVARVERESACITSFYLRPADGTAPLPWRPGQFLPIRVTVPGEPTPPLRTYTLSTCANRDAYRLSIRRADPGRVSRFMHEHARPGMRLEAMTPRGKFALDESSDRPVVLVSAGVGVTPMIAIAEHVVADTARRGRVRPIAFIHGARDGREHAFAAHVRALAARHPAMSVHVAYSRPAPGDRLNVTHQSEGRLTIDTVAPLLPAGEVDVYLCGPASFMQELYAGLIARGVLPDRIHYESFGPGTVLRPEIAPRPATSHLDRVARVRFAASGVEVVWQPEDGTLLELAEAAGIAAPFGCRSGICGTCRTALTHGAVDYLEEPLAARAGDEVLLCCAVPRRARAAGPQRGEPDIILQR
jgi:ferredoxin-NADP reductase/phenylpropionate dioxygenase-like ring-hydroxylating dioxygenase large terminal subunit